MGWVARGWGRGGSDTCDAHHTGWVCRGGEWVGGRAGGKGDGSKTHVMLVTLCVCGWVGGMGGVGAGRGRGGGGVVAVTHVDAHRAT